jgi:hypothetical protein
MKREITNEKRVHNLSQLHWDDWDVATVATIDKVIYTHIYIYLCIYGSKPLPNEAHQQSSRLNETCQVLCQCFRLNDGLSVEGQKIVIFFYRFACQTYNDAAAAAVAAAGGVSAERGSTSACELLLYTFLYRDRLLCCANPCTTFR